MSKTITSHEGVVLNRGESNLSYLYGISDFWSLIFEDPEMVNDVLEANTFMMSETYSKFLQLTSTISLKDIQTTANSQIKLVLLSESDLLTDSLEVNEYKLPEDIIDASYVSNRPFLPTENLEKGVHFHINSESRTIRFNKALDQYKFSFRETSEGVTQYALWLTDARIDEQFVYKHYGKLLDINPQNSVNVYKRFIQGLYYLYTNGPNLRTLERGLNLVMGVPLARETEEVTYIDRHAATNDWLVVTGNNSYRIPFGLAPSVQEGDIIKKGDELSSWVEVKDWIAEDNWWINLSIPPEVISEPPGGDSRAIPGSDVDFLMANYLKTHTFLVKLKTAGVSDLNIFNNITQVVSDVKPSHTFPVYIWAVPLDTEIIDINDDNLEFHLNSHVCENVLNHNREQFRRDNSLYNRGCSFFMRSNTTAKADHWFSELIDTPLVLDDEGGGEIFPDPNLYSGTMGFVPNDDLMEMTEVVGGITPEVNIISRDGPNRSVSVEMVDLVDGTYDVRIESFKDLGTQPVQVRISETISDPTVTTILDMPLPQGASRNWAEGSFTLSSGATKGYIHFIFGSGNDEGISLYKINITLQDSDRLTNRGVVARQNIYERGGFNDAWMSCLHNRGGFISEYTRGHVTYSRRDSDEGHGISTSRFIEGTAIYGTLKGTEPVQGTGLIIEDGHLIPLYNVREQEFKDKMTAVGRPIVTDLPDSMVVIFDNRTTEYSELMIRDALVVADNDAHDDLYNPTFLNSIMPKEGHRLKAVGLDNVRKEDFLVLYRSFDDVFGVFLYKQDRYLTKNYHNYLKPPESLKIGITATEFTRAGYQTDSPVYLTRGATSATYTDSLTTLPVTFDRNNTPGNDINSEKGFV